MEKVVFVRSRRKTLSITVNREGQVIVRMPYGMETSHVISFLERHKIWIARQIAARNKQLEIADGTEICLFGERLTIRSGKTQRKANELYLPAEGREGALSQYIISYGKPYMGELTRKIALQYGFSYVGVGISRARGRWGSCSAKGRITYSYRIAFLPPYIIRAIAVHELCHTRHLNHSALFWREVHKIIPDYSDVRKELKKYEFLMNSL